MKKKYIKRITIALVMIFGGILLTHALVFPNETRSIGISLYDFERNGKLYYRSDASEEKIVKLQKLLKQAEQRVTDFWGEKTATPTFIFCDSDSDYKKFGNPTGSPAVTFLKFQGYVVISSKGIDLDILSHEISHVELYERVGFFNKVFDIPIWFDEGLAMQVDYRSYYSIDTLQLLSDNFKRLPEVTTMNTAAQFFKGNHEEIMQNFRTSKYTISQWYNPKVLKQFIEDIKAGKSFEEAYKIEK